MPKLFEVDVCFTIELSGEPRMGRSRFLKPAALAMTLLGGGAACVPTSTNSVSESEQSSASPIEIGGDSTGGSAASESTFDYGDGSGTVGCPEGETIAGLNVHSNRFWFIAWLGYVDDVGIRCSGSPEEVHWALGVDRSEGTLQDFSFSSGIAGLSYTTYSSAATSYICDIGGVMGPEDLPEDEVHSPWWFQLPYYDEMYLGLALDSCDYSQDQPASGTYHNLSSLDEAAESYQFARTLGVTQSSSGDYEGLLDSIPLVRIRLEAPSGEDFAVSESPVTSGIQ